MRLPPAVAAELHFADARDEGDLPGARLVGREHVNGAVRGHGGNVYNTVVLRLGAR